MNNSVSIRFIGVVDFSGFSPNVKIYNTLGDIIGSVKNFKIGISDVFDNTYGAYDFMKFCIENCSFINSQLMVGNIKLFN